jgi:Na+/H+-dicarboxylate symporter
MKRKIFSLPMQLLGAMALVFCCGHLFSARVVQYFYTFSLLFKECLGFLLPLIIFTFVVTGILAFKKNAPLVLLVLIAFIFASNGIIAIITYGLAHLITPYITHGMQAGSLMHIERLEPLISLQLPQIARSEYALLTAIVVGLVLSWLRLPRIKQILVDSKTVIAGIVSHLFIPLLPVYVFGFLLEMHHVGIFGTMFAQYGKTFVVIVCVQLMVLLAYYLLAAAGSCTQAWRYIRTAVPSYITAFSTMSSTTTIPVSVACAERNMGNRSLAQLAMPIMANIHLVGDAISTPLLALVSMSLFMGTFPDVVTYGVFVAYFCAAMLAVSGIPGGGIIVMMPVLKTHLGFSQEMIGIMLALYMLLDSFGTAANVMGDGALVILVNKMLKKLHIER